MAEKNWAVSRGLCLVCVGGGGTFPCPPYNVKHKGSSEQVYMETPPHLKYLSYSRIYQFTHHKLQECSSGGMVQDYLMLAKTACTLTPRFQELHTDVTNSSCLSTIQLCYSLFDLTKKTWGSSMGTSIYDICNPAVWNSLLCKTAQSTQPNEPSTHLFV